MSPNGDRLRMFKGRVPGVDPTFSAPKPVSVLYALADPLVRRQIVEALDVAVDEAVGWLEREACFVRRGSDNRDRFRGDVIEFGTAAYPAAGSSPPASGTARAGLGIRSCTRMCWSPTSLAARTGAGRRSTGRPCAGRGGPPAPPSAPSCRAVSGSTGS